MLRNEWVENADRWVAGFLEIFEEGCHKMVSSILKTHTVLQKSTNIHDYVLYNLD